MVRIKEIKHLYSFSLCELTNGDTYRFTCERTLKKHLRNLGVVGA
jgi:hypothetical protein